MDKKLKYLKLFIGSFFVAILIGIAGFVVLLIISQQRPSEVINNFFQRPVVISFSDQSCFSSDKVEYLSYKVVPPEERMNNKFGLYIYAENENFMEIAQNLVNSNGGDWGYVLIPYNVKDKDYSRWENVFSRLHNKHLIPIIQLWDLDPLQYENQTKEAAEFLNSFLWPVKQRYISAYNEPNDGKFWYGEANPEEYANILNYTIDIFKEENSNFFIMNGALNISASPGNGYIDGFEFMKRMNQEVPGIFNKLDGWASHSYPQPNFSGSPHTPGRNGIRAYEVELAYLENTLGIEKELPVFITETGWAHAEGVIYNASYLPVEKVSENFRIAFEEYWLKDDRVRAVTPFTIWYNAPFDHFSWINKDYVPYQHYETIKSIKKVKGNPESLESKKLNVMECE